MQKVCIVDLHELRKLRSRFSVYLSQLSMLKIQRKILLFTKTDWFDWLSWVLMWFFKQTWNSSLTRSNTASLLFHMKSHNRSFVSHEVTQQFFWFTRITTNFSVCSFFAPYGLHCCSLCFLLSFANSQLHSPDKRNYCNHVHARKKQKQTITLPCKWQRPRISSYEREPASRATYCTCRDAFNAVFAQNLTQNLENVVIILSEFTKIRNLLFLYVPVRHFKYHTERCVY